MRSGITGMDSGTRIGMKSARVLLTIWVLIIVKCATAVAPPAETLRQLADQRPIVRRGGSQDVLRSLPVARQGRPPPPPPPLPRRNAHAAGNHPHSKAHRSSQGQKLRPPPPPPPPRQQHRPHAASQSEAPRIRPPPPPPPRSRSLVPVERSLVTASTHTAHRPPPPPPPPRKTPPRHYDFDNQAHLSKHDISNILRHPLPDTRQQHACSISTPAATTVPAAPQHAPHWSKHEISETMRHAPPPPDRQHIASVSAKTVSAPQHPQHWSKHEISETMRHPSPPDRQHHASVSAKTVSASHSRHWSKHEISETVRHPSLPDRPQAFTHPKTVPTPQHPQHLPKREISETMRHPPPPPDHQHRASAPETKVPTSHSRHWSKHEISEAMRHPPPPPDHQHRVSAPETKVPTPHSEYWSKREISKAMMHPPPPPREPPVRVKPHHVHAQSSAIDESLAHPHPVQGYSERSAVPAVDETMRDTDYRHNEVAAQERDHEKTVHSTAYESPATAASNDRYYETATHLSPPTEPVPVPEQPLESMENSFYETHAPVDGNQRGDPALWLGPLVKILRDAAVQDTATVNSNERPALPWASALMDTALSVSHEESAIANRLLQFAAQTSRQTAQQTDDLFESLLQLLSTLPPPPIAVAPVVVAKEKRERLELDHVCNEDVAVAVETQQLMAPPPGNPVVQPRSVTTHRQPRRTFLSSIADYDADLGDSDFEALLKDMQQPLYISEEESEWEEEELSDNEQDGLDIWSDGEEEDVLRQVFADAEGEEGAVFADENYQYEDEYEDEYDEIWSDEEEVWEDEAVVVRRPVRHERSWAVMDLGFSQGDWQPTTHLYLPRRSAYGMDGDSLYDPEEEHEELFDEGDMIVLRDANEVEWSDLDALESIFLERDELSDSDEYDESFGADLDDKALDSYDAELLRGSNAVDNCLESKGPIDCDVIDAEDDDDPAAFEIEYNWKRAPSKAVTDEVYSSEASLNHRDTDLGESLESTGEANNDSVGRVDGKSEWSLFGSFLNPFRRKKLRAPELIKLRAPEPSGEEPNDNYSRKLDPDETVWHAADSDASLGRGVTDGEHALISEVADDTNDDSIGRVEVKSEWTFFGSFLNPFRRKKQSAPEAITDDTGTDEPRQPSPSESFAEKEDSVVPEPVAEAKNDREDTHAPDWKMTESFRKPKRRSILKFWEWSSFRSSPAVDAEIAATTEDLETLDALDKAASDSTLVKDLEEIDDDFDEMNLGASAVDSFEQYAQPPPPPPPPPVHSYQYGTATNTFDSRDPYNYGVR